MNRAALILAFVLLFPHCGRAADRDVRVADLDGAMQSPVAGGERVSVLLFVTHDCPISNGYAPEYRRLREDYPTNQVVFFVVYVDPDATLERLLRHRSEFGLSGLTAIHDREHRLVSATGAEMTPEAVVVAKDGGIAYRGRVDNLFADYGKRRREATQHELRAAMDDVLAGRPVATPRAAALGCPIPALKISKK